MPRDCLAEVREPRQIIELSGVMPERPWDPAEKQQDRKLN
jgi:hypothetical protein